MLSKLQGSAYEAAAKLLAVVHMLFIYKCFLMPDVLGTKCCLPNRKQPWPLPQVLGEAAAWRG